MQQWFAYRLEQEIYLPTNKKSRQALGYTQHPVLRVPGYNSREAKGSGRVKITTTSPHLVLRSNMSAEVASLTHVPSRTEHGRHISSFYSQLPVLPGVCRDNI